MGEKETNDDRAVQIARLWSKAQPVVGAMIAGAVIDFHDAEDLGAEVAELIVRKFDEYDRSRPFVPWALGIGRNLILRYYERRAGERRVYFKVQTLQLLEAAHMEIAEEAPASLAALRHCIESIRGKSRRVLEMRYMYDLKPDAVADALGASRNAIWVMLHRVREALRKCIEE
jgi:RNA polymerase sigma-70 factor (ECF subfamily)